MVEFSSNGHYFTQDCEVTEAGREKLARLFEKLSGPPYGKITTPDIEAVEGELPVSFIGSGSKRAVFSIDGKDCVVKISLFEDPYQNENEVINWNEMLPEGIKHRFASIKDYERDRHSWLVMEEGELEPSKKKIREALEDIILNYGIDLRDFNEGNFGLVNGETVMVDYGFLAHQVEDIEGWDNKHDLFDYAIGVMKGTADVKR